MQEVVGKILFDYVALVAAADNKIMDAMARVGLHDVSQNGLATNFNHGLGSSGRFFTDTSAKAACKNDCFQMLSSTLNCSSIGFPPSCSRALLERLFLELDRILLLQGPLQLLPPCRIGLRILT